MSLIPRLQLLADGGVIDDEVLHLMGRIIRLIEQETNLLLNEENGAAMVTHFAMALMRLKKGEIADKNSRGIEDLEELESLPQAWQILNKIEVMLPWPLPQVEQDYMLINLCVLLEGELT